MPELTKMRHNNNQHTDITIITVNKKPFSGKTVEKKILGPVEMVDTAMELLSKLSFYDMTDYVNANELNIDRSPGKSLRAYRNREGLTQTELAKRSGISRKNLSWMENNKLPIDKQTAKKLAGILNCNAKRFS